MADQDPERTLALMDPVSLRVLLDYGPALRSTLEMPQGGMQITESGSLDAADLSEEPIDDDHVKVYLDHVEISNTTEYHTDVPTPDATSTETLTLDGTCGSWRTDGIVDPLTQCLPDQAGGDRVFLVAVKNPNGTWYISPLDTLAAYGDAAIGVMNQQMADMIFGGGIAAMFIGAQDRASDKAAQSGLRNSLAADKTCCTDTDTYEGCDARALAQIEVALTWSDAPRPSTGPADISVEVGSDGIGWSGAALSETGTCFYIRDDANVGTFYGQAQTPPHGCVATDAASVSAAAWIDGVPSGP